MKIAWKNNKKRPLGIVSKYPNLPFEQQNDQLNNQADPANEPNKYQNHTELNQEEHHEPLDAQSKPSDSSDAAKLFHSFQAEGTKLAEGGKYREALGKWEAALMLMPENAVLHEQKTGYFSEETRDDRHTAMHLVKRRKACKLQGKIVGS
ncbi:hypothetical protein ACE6H2_004869 [Prunus campanulata]